MWEAAKPLRLSARERELLEGFARAGSTPQKIGLRVRIVLRSADGVANHRLASELGTSRPTVLRWRQRFEQAGLEGLLEDAPRPGRKRRLTPEKEEAIVNATLYSKPPGATHWSVRTLAQAQRVSPATVHRVWKAHRLQPHRVKNFKLSTDPKFFHKLHDIVGLYLNPPTQALVLSLDEKSQIQALDRTQPILPLRPGIPERQKPRLHTPWDDNVVRCAQRVERRGAGGLHAAPSPPRVSALSGAHRAPHAPSAGDSSDPRQLCYAHASGCGSMVCGSPPLSPALHAHRRFLAELGGTLLRRDY